MQKEECFDIFERYIQNRANDEEVKRLINWIKSNQEISLWLEQQILDSASSIDADVRMRMLMNITKEIESADQTNSPINSKNVRLIFNKWMRIAAMFILPIFTAAIMYLYMSRNESSTSSPLVVAVERGQKANITLPDGSRVWLNSQSKLTYTADFNISQRELLLDGEAYFEVAHNPEKPFIVKSKDMAVEALGTAFGVKAYSEDNMITSILMRGKVRVTTPAGENILLPNERILYDKAKHEVVKSEVANATDFTGWIHNELRFENESLEEIGKNIHRVYNVEIIFASEKLKYIRYTGTINNNSLESVLNIISLTSPITFNIDSQKVTFYEKKHE